jgi:hypothetical protein
MVLFALVAAIGCEASDETGGIPPRPASTPAAAATPVDHAGLALRCVDAADWECAAHEVRQASVPEATRARVVAALEAEAKRREKVLKLARPGRDRLVAAQDAAAAWALWSDVSGKPLPASGRRAGKTAAKEEKAAAHREAAEPKTFVPERECCKHCTTGCACGDSCISCAKRCDKGPGCAC